MLSPSARFHSHQHRRQVFVTLSSRKALFLVVWTLVFATIFLWQSSDVGVLGIFRQQRRARPCPKLRPVAFNLTDFGGVGDGYTLNTEAFVRAVKAIKQLAGSGGGQLNVQLGVWLTGPFNLTSHMTLFLAEGAVILGTQDEKYWPLMPPLPSYGYGREQKGPRYSSLIHGQNLQDVVITGHQLAQ